MICPFFRKDCLKEKCAAYEWKENVWGPVEYDFDGGGMHQSLRSYAYCNALRCELPERKE